MVSAGGEKLKIREMTVADAAEAARLEQECFSMPWSQKIYESTLANPDTFYLVAEEDTGDGKLFVGMCGFQNILGEADISNVAVREGFRRQGIAEKLMRLLLEEGRRQGIEAFTLEVRSSNEAAIRLYEKFGFVTEGVRKRFYEKPVEDALIMWLR